VPGLPAAVELNREQLILGQVLRGIALNREPGFHFPGNFLEISFERVTPAETRLTLEPGPHCVDADGQADIGVLALFADLALASSIRAGLKPATRLATVSMNLQFTGAKTEGTLEAVSVFEGFFSEGAARQGLSRVVISSRTRRICFGNGAFMVLKPPQGVTLHPVPQRKRGEATLPPLSVVDLTRDEREILRRAEKGLATAGAGAASFISRFWGYEPRPVAGGASATMKNGPHIGNRVGHAQGGIMLGMAAATARAALPRSWGLSGVSAWYVSPGEGARLRARSKIIHYGRLTAVMRTEITGQAGRRVLEVVTTHARRGPRGE
jgi:acyl-coenzyme A thioesterase PaaI-like protein